MEVREGIQDQGNLENDAYLGPIHEPLDAVLRTMLTYITKEQNNTFMWKWRTWVPTITLGTYPMDSTMCRPDIIISPKEGYEGFIFIELTCSLESNATATGTSSSQRC